ncbi:hypothetical protein JSO19_07220 [Leucobacter sp. UCMA 4100]|uniref:hypothetical protein n=1 Tax=Leucobacter sp. UCMA 4100 TaxID=2810534 RepID=UPI0022EA4BD3|nr:hypothetical protein [Leucobacter sp. UCMA 4100]MDA3147167.1 hypothetical protein [Leucobacter sp. UCMA 4100]
MKTSWKTRTGIAATAALSAMMLALGSPAYATEGSAPPEPGQTNSDIEYTPVKPTEDRVFINGEPTDIAVMPDFDPKAPAVVIDDNGPVAVEDLSVVSSDGLVSELSTVLVTDKAALASCWTGWVAPGTGTWYTSSPGCSVIGISPSATAGYDWTVDFSSNGSACLQGRGYKARHLPGGGTARDEYFGGLGCGGGGSSGGGVVTCGEVASTKVVKAMATSAPVGAAGMFQ